jgi:CHASE3 domain sensor protein
MKLMYLWAILMTLGLLIFVQKLEETRKVIDQGTEASRLASELYIDTADAMRGERGYIITGEEDFLDPLRRCERMMPVHKEALYALTSPEEKEKVQRMVALADSHLDRMRMVSEARRKEGFEAARKLVLERRGKIVMDELTVLSDEVDAARQEKLAKARKTLNHHIANMRLVVFAGILLSVFDGLTSFVRRRYQSYQSYRSGR